MLCLSSFHWLMALSAGMALQPIATNLEGPGCALFCLLSYLDMATDCFCQVAIMHAGLVLPAGATSLRFVGVDPRVGSHHKNSRLYRLTIGCKARMSVTEHPHASIMIRM